MTNKEICYYHSDMDGIASAAIIKNIHPDCELKSINYGQEADVYKKEDIIDKTVFIVDFSFSKEIMEEINTNSELLCWVDHHKSAKEALPELWGSDSIDGIRSLDKSGCELTWDWFYPHEDAPRVIKLIGDYDTWAFKYGESTKYFGAISYLYLTDPNGKCWKMFLNFKNDIDVALLLEEWLSKGETLIKVQQQRVEKSFKTGTKMLARKYSVLCVNANPEDSSVLGNYICKQGYDVGMTWCVKNGSVDVGLRSIGDIDVSEIAKMFGGGGHKNASGFTIDIDDICLILKNKRLF